MDILKKYKKQFDKGFKEFVLNLDLRPSRVTKEVMTQGLLEDPVYLKWALENKHHFEYFLKMNDEEVYKVLISIPGGVIVLLQALKNHSDEYHFISSKLPRMIHKQYIVDREVQKITVAQQENARIKIMQTVFDMKENGELGPFEWKLPPVKVMNGTDYTIDAVGEFKQFYDSGILALSGKIVKGKRVDKWINFYPNGAIHAEGEYVDGQKEKEWLIYFLNGKIKSSGCFRQDLKNGEWKEYEMSGQVAIVKYHNGKIVS